MNMTTPANPCDACGACCDHPEPWSTIDLTLEDLARVPAEMTVPSWGDWRKMARVGNRCVALVGTIGVDARCSIYEDRPQICRDYDPVLRVTDCNMCRAPHGLDPRPA
jgi:Fe-S-cluster containining protein